MRDNKVERIYDYTCNPYIVMAFQTIHFSWIVKQVKSEEPQKKKREVIEHEGKTPETKNWEWKEREQRFTEDITGGQLSDLIDLIIKEIFL